MDWSHDVMNRFPLSRWHISNQGIDEDELVGDMPEYLAQVRAWNQDVRQNIVNSDNSRSPKFARSSRDDLAQLAKDYEKRLKSAERRIERKEQELSAARSELDGMRKEQLLAAEDLARVIQDCDDMRQKWQEATMELDSIKVRYDSHMDDDHFVSEWKKLRYSIENCIDQHLRGDDADDSAYDNYVKLLRAVTNDPPGLIKVKENGPLLVQSLIWSFLCHSIFGNHHVSSANAWAVDSSRSFQQLAEILRPSSADDEQSKEYYGWRSTTAHLLQKHHLTKTRQRDMVAGLAAKLANPLEPWNVSKPEAFGRDLQQIIDTAIRLEIDMERQIASYFVQSWDPTTGAHPFDRSEMESRNNGTAPRSGESYIDLVVCPALMKAGHSEGEQYNMEKVLVRALVLVKSPGRLNSSASSPSINTTSDIAETNEKVKMRLQVRRSESLRAPKGSKGSPRNEGRHPRGIVSRVGRIIHGSKDGG